MIDPPSSPPPHSRAHGVFVRLMIFVTVLLSVTMLGILTFRWLTVEEPTSYIQVDGSSRFDGINVTVEGFGMTQALSATLDKANEFRSRFFLEPGNYVVHVTQGRQELAIDRVSLYAREYVLIDLTRIVKTPPTTSTSPPQPPAKQP